MSLGPQQGTNRAILASKETLYLSALAPRMGYVSRVESASIQPALETQPLREPGQAPASCPPRNSAQTTTALLAGGLLVPLVMTSLLPQRGGGGGLGAAGLGPGHLGSNPSPTRLEPLTLGKVLDPCAP